MNRRLKAKIIEKFGTQSEFAQIAGIDETFVSRVVRNRRKLRPEEQRFWSRLLGVKPEEVFSN